MRTYPILFALLFLIACQKNSDPVTGPAATKTLPLLTVAEEAPCLMRDELPFLWLADRNWEFFHRSAPGDLELYLDDRAHKNFRVVQTALIGEFASPYAAGASSPAPLLADGWNPDFLSGVDHFLKEAAARGLYVALLPIRENHQGAEADRIDAARATILATQLGNHFREQSNLIWLVAGPHAGATLKGLRAGGVTQLIAHQGPATTLLAEADIHLVEEAVFAMPEIPSKQPRIDGLPPLDNAPTAAGTYSTDADMRRRFYSSMLSGAKGYVYGSNALAQFYYPGFKAKHRPRQHWKSELHLPAPEQLGYALGYLQKFAWETLIPDASLLSGSQESSIVAARGREDDFILVYTPTGQPLTVDPRVLKADSVQVDLYNPRDGLETELGRIGGQDLIRVEPPVAGTDWLVVFTRY